MNEYESITEELASTDPIAWSGGEECCYCGGKANWEDPNNDVTVFHTLDCLWWRAHSLFPGSQDNPNVDHVNVPCSAN